VTPQAIEASPLTATACGIEIALPLPVFQCPGIGGVLTLRSVAELSGILAFDAWRVLYADAPDAKWLYEYEVLSRRRLKDWSDAMTHAEGNPSLPLGDEMLVGIANEIVTWDIPARLSAAWLKGHRVWNGAEQAQRTARRIVADQCQAKQAVFTALLGRTPSLPLMAQCNSLRRRCERWTDQLISHCHFAAAAREFAIDVERMQEFGRRGARSRTAVARHFTLIGLARAIPPTPIGSGRCETQHQIARHLVDTVSRQSFFNDGRLMDARLRELGRGIRDVS